MPDIIPPGDGGPISVEEFVELFQEFKTEPGDEDGLAEASVLLQRAFKNRTFLNDALLKYIGQQTFDRTSEGSSAQSMKVSGLGLGRYIRAVFWPCAKEDYFEKGDASLFYYGRPHDHSFTFATLGYAGPGYESDYYELEEPSLDLHAGQPVRARFLGRQTLSPGKVMLYRRHVDIHSQLAPSENSISINIIDPSPQSLARNQYIFDSSVTHVESVLQNRFSATVFALAALGETGEGQAALERIAGTPGDSLVRFHAWRILSGRSGDREHWLRDARASGDRKFVGWVNTYASVQERDAATNNQESSRLA